MKSAHVVSHTAANYKNVIPSISLPIQIKIPVVLPFENCTANNNDSSPATMSSLTQYRLWFHVPVDSLEACKKAIFTAGAGQYPGLGDYTEVCFVVIGKGQFRPGQTAKPHIGKVGELEHTEEAKVETICVGEETMRKVIAALKA